MVSYQNEGMPDKGSLIDGREENAMAEDPVQTKERKPAPMDIPWLRLWDRREKAVRSERELSKRARLENIEFMTMLEELEFH